MEKIKNSRDVVRIVRPHLSHEGQEELWVLSLDGDNRVRDMHLTGLGSDRDVVICNKAIARHAVLDMAYGVVIVHNHPSGNPVPSKADVSSTESLREGLRYLGIALIDHVILGDGRHFSFEEGKTMND